MEDLMLDCTIDSNCTDTLTDLMTVRSIMQFSHKDFF